MRASGVAIVAGLVGMLGAGCQWARSEPAAPPPTDPAIPAPCVHFEDLRAFLPADLQGFARVRDEGSTGKYGDVSVSEAERVFRSESPSSGSSGSATAEDERQLSVRIVDTTLAKRLGKAIRDAAADAQRRGTEDPTAPFIAAGTVGFLRFDPSEQKAEANLLVGDRYVVAVSSFGFEGTDEVRRVAAGLNLAGLSKLR